MSKVLDKSRTTAIVDFLFSREVIISDVNIQTTSDIKFGVKLKLVFIKMSLTEDKNI